MIEANVGLSKSLHHGEQAYGEVRVEAKCSTHFQLLDVMPCEGYIGVHVTVEGSVFTWNGPDPVATIRATTTLGELGLFNVDAINLDLSPRKATTARVGAGGYTVFLEGVSLVVPCSAEQQNPGLFVLEGTGKRSAIEDRRARHFRRRGRHMAADEGGVIARPLAHR